MSMLTPLEDDLFSEGLRPYELWAAKSKKMLDAWQRQEASAGYRTGLQALDNYIRLVPGELTVLAGRPGMGKTAFFMQVAGNLVSTPESDERVAIFSAEMAGWSLSMRLACAVANVSMFRLRSGRADVYEYEAVRMAIEGLKRLPLLIDDKSRPSIEYMRDELARMASVYKLNAVMTDFVELIDSEGRTEEQRISNVIRGHKEIAKDFDVPVLAVSHLSRSVEDRADKMPYLSDLRYSGMIEQIADQVILMVRPKYYLDKGMSIELKSYPGFNSSNLEDIAYLPIAKNRNGDTAIVKLGYDGPKMRFYDFVSTPLNAPQESAIDNGDREDEQE